jgi:DNA-binding transcriptional LysR family regulator
MDLNSAKIFTRVVRLGSFTKAARDMGIPNSTVSDKVSELEESLGVELLVRTTRKLRLTDAGSKFFKKAELAIAELLNAGEEASLFQKRPSGTLRITAPADFNHAPICEAIAEYKAKFPGVEVELHLTNRVVDMIGEGYDIAIRASRINDTSLTAKRLTASGHILVASPRYLQKATAIRDPSDLREHKCLIISSDQNSDPVVWTLVSLTGKRVKLAPGAHIASNSATAIKFFVLVDEGIALLPPTLVYDEIANRLMKHVLPEWSMPTQAGFLVYTAHQHSSPKVREMIPILEPRIRSVIK